MCQGENTEEHEKGPSCCFRRVIEIVDGMDRSIRTLGNDWVHCVETCDLMSVSMIGLRWFEAFWISSGISPSYTQTLPDMVRQQYYSLDEISWLRVTTCQQVVRIEYAHFQTVGFAAELRVIVELSKEESNTFKSRPYQIRRPPSS